MIWSYVTKLSNFIFLIMLSSFNVYLPSPVISKHLKLIAATSHDIYAALQRFLVKFRHYGIDQLYLRKVSYYLIDWRLFVYNIASCIYDVAFKIIEYILLLYIFCIIRVFFSVTIFLKKIWVMDGFILLHQILI